MPDATISPTSWGMFDGGLVRMQAVPIRIQVLLRPYGGSWAWMLVEGGVTEISGLALTLEDAQADAERQAAEFPTIISGAQWHE